jgi:hypothetical protein
MSRQGVAYRKPIADRPAQLATLLLFTADYVIVVGCFAHVDVYHDHFFERAYSRSYNLFRIVFCAYLFWLVYLGRARIDRDRSLMPRLAPQAAEKANIAGGPSPARN